MFVTLLASAMAGGRAAGRARAVAGWGVCGGERRPSARAIFFFRPRPGTFGLFSATSKSTRALIFFFGSGAIFWLESDQQKKKNKKRNNKKKKGGV